MRAFSLKYGLKMRRIRASLAAHSKDFRARSQGYDHHSAAGVQTALPVRESFKDTARNKHLAAPQKLTSRKDREPAPRQSSTNETALVFRALSPISEIGIGTKHGLTRDSFLDVV
jgi:hypothetical protein